MIWGIYFLAAFGLAYIMGHAKITMGLRILLGGQGATPAFTHPVTKESFPAQPALKPMVPVVGPFLVDLLECVACSSTWIGFASSFVMPQPEGFHFSSPVWFLVLGCATCASSYIIAGLTFRGQHV